MGTALPWSQFWGLFTHTSANSVALLRCSGQEQDLLFRKLQEVSRVVEVSGVALALLQPQGHLCFLIPVLMVGRGVWFLLLSLCHHKADG